MLERDRIEQAGEKHEQAKAALFRSDGSKVYGEETHGERLAEIEREFRTEMDAIEADVDRRVEEAESSLLRAEHTAPADALTNEELERANALRPFVSDEAFNLPLDQLERRLRAAAASGDRPTMFLLAHFAAQRVGEPGGILPDTSDPLTAPSVASEGAEPVRQAIADLRKGLDPDGERKKEQAREAVQEAKGLKELAYYRRRGVSDAAGLHIRENYRRPV